MPWCPASELSGLLLRSAGNAVRRVLVTEQLRQSAAELLQSGRLETFSAAQCNEPKQSVGHLICLEIPTSTGMTPVLD